MEENMINRELYKTNKSGYSGVFARGKSDGWVAVIGTWPNRDQLQTQTIDAAILWRIEKELDRYSIEFLDIGPEEESYLDRKKEIEAVELEAKRQEVLRRVLARIASRTTEEHTNGITCKPSGKFSVIVVWKGKKKERAFRTIEQCNAFRLQLLTEWIWSHPDT